MAAHDISGTPSLQFNRKAPSCSLSSSTVVRTMIHSSTTSKLVRRVHRPMTSVVARDTPQPQHPQPQPSVPLLPPQMQTVHLQSATHQPSRTRKWSSRYEPASIRDILFQYRMPQYLFPNKTDELDHVLAQLDIPCPRVKLHMDWPLLNRSSLHRLMHSLVRNMIIVNDMVEDHDRAAGDDSTTFRLVFCDEYGKAELFTEADVNTMRYEHHPMAETHILRQLQQSEALGFASSGHVPNGLLMTSPTTTDSAAMSSIWSSSDYSDAVVNTLDREHQDTTQVDERENSSVEDASDRTVATRINDVALKKPRSIDDAGRRGDGPVWKQETEESSARHTELGPPVFWSAHIDNIYRDANSRSKHAGVRPGTSDASTPRHVHVRLICPLGSRQGLRRRLLMMDHDLKLWIADDWRHSPSNVRLAVAWTFYAVKYLRRPEFMACDPSGKYLWLIDRISSEFRHSSVSDRSPYSLLCFELSSDPFDVAKIIVTLHSKRDVCQPPVSAVPRHTFVADGSSSAKESPTCLQGRVSDIAADDQFVYLAFPDRHVIEQFEPHTRRWTVIGCGHPAIMDSPCDTELFESSAKRLGLVLPTDVSMATLHIKDDWACGFYRPSLMCIDPSSMNRLYVCEIHHTSDISFRCYHRASRGVFTMYSIHTLIEFTPRYFQVLPAGSRCHGYTFDTDAAFPVAVIHTTAGRLLYIELWTGIAEMAAHLAYFMRIGVYNSMCIMQYVWNSMHEWQAFTWEQHMRMASALVSYVEFTWRMRQLNAAYKARTITTTATTVPSSARTVPLQPTERDGVVVEHPSLTTNTRVSLDTTLQTLDARNSIESYKQHFKGLRQERVEDIHHAVMANQREKLIGAAQEENGYNSEEDSSWDSNADHDDDSYDPDHDDDDDDAYNTW